MSAKPYIIVVGNEKGGSGKSTTALHIAAGRTAHETLLPAMDELHHALDSKRKQFWGMLKIGRTHLQDAVPMRLGQEFGGYARQVESSQARVRQALEGVQDRLSDIVEKNFYFGQTALLAGTAIEFIAPFDGYFESIETNVNKAITTGGRTAAPTLVGRTL